MLFNSLDFAVFMPVVFLIYWALKNHVTVQNIFLLAASYFFYAWWDWRFLSLIFLCTAVNYTAGLMLMKFDEVRWRKLILTFCVVVCLGVLGLFKYYNFFITSFSDVFSLFGSKFQVHTLNLILPIGISFYTFHTLSYTIDVYRKHFKPTKDIISFSLFVSIFPLAMAGPIERATNLLPQIYKKRIFDRSKSVDGLRQILWGLFKKVVIADNCAIFVNDVFANYHNYSGSTLLLGALFFSFQIYGDFSGYSDMAIGIGKLLGFNFLKNFHYPYFSRDIAEFWRRWHISLNTWFRDYIYIPLGGSRGSKWMVVRNTFAIFLISGLWHGANWTFIAWGAYHALLFLPLILLNKNRRHTDTVAHDRLFPDIKETFQMVFTFLLVLFGWIVFRADNINIAFDYFSRMFSATLFSRPYLISRDYYIYNFAMLFVFVLVEWIQRDKEYALELSRVKSQTLRFGIYYLVLLLILILGGTSKDFIYFQF